MNTYFLEPKAPLVFRTGRPFGSTGGGDTLDFPLPSTVAGAMRRTVIDRVKDSEGNPDLDKLRQLTCLGPLLAFQTPSTLTTVLFPAPADALYFETTTQHHRPEIIRCEPTPKREDGEGSDLPDLLQPILPINARPDKPSHAMAFWPQRSFKRWLLNETPSSQSLKAVVDVSATPPLSTRAHVCIDRKTHAHAEGALFQSTGLDFARRLIRSEKDVGSYWEPREFGLLLKFDGQSDHHMVKVGGESRLAHIQPANDDWPSCPEKLSNSLAKAHTLRLILVTPAYFTQGYLPDWLDETLTGSPPNQPGLRLKLHAVACKRWQPWSGWDLAEKKPKPLKRLVPAGSVYWFSVESESEQVDATRLWLTSLSIDEQARSDGFGMAVPGLWAPSSDL